MKRSEFVHLHLHSQYSLLDGAIQFKPLFKKLNALKMDAVALTDHGAMFGAVEFCGEAITAGVRPIVGCEAYVAPASRFDRGPVSSDASTDRSHHLVLLAQDDKGYRNLCALVSAGYLEGFYYKPRVDKELLARHAEGLIALSACLHGEVAANLLHGREDAARQAAGFYKETFPGRFYLEVQNHGLEGQKAVNPRMIALARAMGLPLVATNDAHYLNRDDAEAHDALLCIGTGKSVADPRRLRYDGDQFYVKSEEEMRALFGEIPEALTNTLAIAEQCAFRFEEGKIHLPRFPIPAPDLTIEQFLRQTAVNGLEHRFAEAARRGKPLDDAAKRARMVRLEMELGVISKMGFPGYFLITWDFIRYAREKGIPVGPGRGSAAGSMVAWALRITELDPIEYGLIFERFLNPDRISMPDIDIDFCMDRRGEVIEYVRARYGGTSNVAQIITFGAMKAKAVVRDVARVLDMPYAQADKIAKLIPNDLKITIEKALEEEPRLRAMEKESQEVERLLRVSRALEGTARHASTHAAGVVISPEPLIHYLPLYKAPDKEDITTQYQMGDVEKLGLLKMDFLGLRTLTVINNTAVQIRKNHDSAFDIDLIALDDGKTFELLGAARTLGVFQLESSGMRDLIRKMKPTTFQDIIALVALFRPGPINSGMADQYVKRKHGHEEVTYEFPQAREALEETYGVIVYQEQVMKIANLLAGFTMAQADALRKAMGKKKQEIMDQLRDKFVSGAVKLGHEQKKAAALWENIEKFGEYGFNKSHSACYALVAYQTAYLKAHYPAEYMAALLSSEADNTDKAQRYLQECRDLKLAVAPPDVNKSQSEFAVVEGAVRFGLSAIKGMGETAARAIIEARDEGGPFTSLAGMAGRVKPQTLNRRAMEAMVKCGAFDFTGKSRAGLFGSVEQALGAAQKAQRDREIGQSSLFAALGGAAPEADAALDLPEWPEKERLAYEKEALGFYLSGHPLNASAADLKRLATFTTATLANAAHRAEARMGGMITARKYMNNKKGERFARVTLEDLAGSVEALIWPDVLAKNLELVESEEPVFIKGQADVDDENGAKLIAQEIMTIAEARKRFTNSVHVNVSTPGLEPETLEQLRGIFARHRGKCEVALHFNIPGKGELTMRAGGLRVTADETLIGAVEEILGEESVYLQ